MLYTSPWLRFELTTSVVILLRFMQLKAQNKYIICESSINGFHMVLHNFFRCFFFVIDIKFANLTTWHKMTKRVLCDNINIRFCTCKQIPTKCYLVKKKKKKKKKKKGAWKIVSIHTANFATNQKDVTSTSSWNFAPRIYTVTWQRTVKSSLTKCNKDLKCPLQGGSWANAAPEKKDEQHKYN
jgi:hypothetical protein